MILRFRVTEHRNAVAGTVVFGPSLSFPHLRLAVSDCHRSTASCRKWKSIHEFYIFRVGSVAEYNFTPCDSVLTLLCASSRELLFIKFHLLNEVNFIIAGSVASVNCLVYTISSSSKYADATN